MALKFHQKNSAPGGVEHRVEAFYLSKIMIMYDTLCKVARNFLCN